MDIAIAGGGLGGLTAAISLRRAGHNHRITIYERSSFTNEVGAAIHVPPSVSRILMGPGGWGIDPKKARFIKSEGAYYLDIKTLEERMFQTHAYTKPMFGGDVFYAHRVDLHSKLREIATSPNTPGVPVKIVTGAEVVDYDAEAPSITLADGSVVKADLVIAADGVHSLAVKTLLGKPNPALPRPGQQSSCCYRFLIPAAELAADPETAFFVDPKYKSATRGYVATPQRRIIVYQVRDHEILNFVAICADEERISIEKKKEDWHATVDVEELIDHYSDYNPKFLAVLRKATDVKRWPLLYRQPLPTWRKGNLIVIGDAAHPMLPKHAQGAAQAMEDGTTLGILMSGATDASQVPERLALFEKLRCNRASAVQVMSSSEFTEPVPEEAYEFLEGRKFETFIDIVKYEYGHDVVGVATEAMKSLDPNFKLPEEYLLG